MPISYYNTRPISVISFIWKIYDKCLNRELKNNMWNKEGQWKLNQQQTGFMEGQGTEINIYRLLNQLNKLQLNENNKMI